MADPVSTWLIIKLLPKRCDGYELLSSIVPSIVTLGLQLLPCVAKGDKPYVNLTRINSQDTSLQAASSQLRLVTVTSQETS